jgi:hypothetical protein
VSPFEKPRHFTWQLTSVQPDTGGALHSTVKSAKNSVMTHHRRNFFGAREALVVLLFLAVTATGCFDLETEVRFLEDGSGFVTQWVRIDTADVTVAAAIQGSTVQMEIASTIAALDSMFETADGVALLDREVYSEADRTVLRYRYMFENSDSLGRYLNNSALDRQLIVPYGGGFKFRSTPAKCGGTYDLDFSFRPRSEEAISEFGHRDIDALSAEDKEAVIRKFYSGKMSLRIVLPGKTTSHSAEALEPTGFPVFRTTVLDLFRTGLKGHVRSRVACDTTEQSTPDAANTPAVPITFGYVPSPEEIARVARNLGHFGQMAIEFNCLSRGRVEITVTYLLSEPIRGPFEFYFPLLFAAFPLMEAEYDTKLELVGDGRYRYRFTSKKPVNLAKLGSRNIFYGRDKGSHVFRLNLPPMKFGAARPEGAASPVMLRVRVTLPKNIRVSNALDINENTATWALTDKMLENKITIEALSE